MQSLLRNLAWSTPPALDKPVYQTKSMGEINQAKKITKRKRVSDLSSSPKAAPPKKLRLDGGAVQAAPGDVVALDGYAPQEVHSRIDAVAGAQREVKDFKRMIGSNARSEDLVHGGLARNETTTSPRTTNAKTSPKDQKRSRKPSVGSKTAGVATLPPSATKLANAGEVHSTEQKSHSATTPLEQSMEAKLKSILLAHINHAILEKHNEMRLIDHELAKCQIALEQIRRCDEIPWPGYDGPDSALSQHSGPSLVPRPGMTIPTKPAPWGVVNGPYTRHMAGWLIQSDTFDSQPAPVYTPLNTPYHRDGRATRASGIDVAPLSFYSSRSARTSQARRSFDPQSPGASRDPLVILRQQDNKMVKLYCTACQPERSDFANIQGFINHCRISHKQEYKSHELAAIACGRPVEASDVVATPVVATSRESFSAAPRPAVVTPFVKALGVHPLVTGNNEKRSIDQVVPYLPSSATPKQETPTHVSFVQSTSAPYLSEMLKATGFAGNFGDVTTRMKIKEDLSMYDDVPSETEDPPAKKSKKASPAKPTRGPGRPAKSGMSVNGVKPKASQSRANGVHARNSTLPRLSTNNNQRSSAHQRDELSPATADSNPGLISDREDDAEGDEDASSEQHQGQEQDHDRDVIMIDLEDSDVDRRHSATERPETCRR